LTGRSAVLAAAGGSAYARLMMSSSVTGFAADGALAWTSVGPWGPVACLIGPIEPCAALVAVLLASGQLDDIPHLHAPVGCPIALPFL
jgi:hypothetical protein